MVEPKNAAIENKKNIELREIEDFETCILGRIEKH